MRWLLFVFISSLAYGQKGSQISLTAGAGYPFSRLKIVNAIAAGTWHGFHVDPPLWVGLNLEPNHSFRIKLGHQLKYYFLPQKTIGTLATIVNHYHYGLYNPYLKFVLTKAISLSTGINYRRLFLHRTHYPAITRIYEPYYPTKDVFEITCGLDYRINYRLYLSTHYEYGINKFGYITPFGKNSMYPEFYSNFWSFSLKFALINPTPRIFEIQENVKPLRQKKMQEMELTHSSL